MQKTIETLNAYIITVKKVPRGVDELLKRPLNTCPPAQVHYKYKCKFNNFLVTMIRTKIWRSRTKKKYNPIRVQRGSSIFLDLKC